MIGTINGIPFEVKAVTFREPGPGARNRQHPWPVEERVIHLEVDSREVERLIDAIHEKSRAHGNRA